MQGAILRQLIYAAIVSGSVALAARRLGYSGFLWFFAQLFGGWFTLGMVSSLPDRRLEGKRQAELTILRKELAGARQLSRPGTAVPENTIGDLKTIRS